MRKIINQHKMELKEILSISGVPGLYKYVAQGKGGIIVESLGDSRRTMVGGSSKVSALGDIAIFTDSEEVALAEIFQSIFDKNDGSTVTLSNKSTDDELHAFLGDVLPNYDRERVHTSDIKKLVSWYNILVGAGMTEFKVEEQDGEDEDESSVIPKTKSESTAVAKKQVVKNTAPKAASQPKVVTPKSTTNRKSGN